MTVILKAAVQLAVFSLFIPFIIVSSTSVSADGASCRVHEFHGTVTSNGHSVGSGFTVSAFVNGQQVASTTTDTQGKWGYNQPFIVDAPAGSTIDFYINSTLVGSASSCIETDELNLSAGGAPPPVSTPSSTSSTTQPDTSVKSSATITFFIGPQSSGSSSSNTNPANTSSADHSPAASSAPTTPEVTAPEQSSSPTNSIPPPGTPPDSATSPAKADAGSAQESSQKRPESLDPIPILAAVALGGLVIILIISRI